MVRLKIPDRKDYCGDTRRKPLERGAISADRSDRTSTEVCRRASRTDKRPCADAYRPVGSPRPLQSLSLTRKGWTVILTGSAHGRLAAFPLSCNAGESLVGAIYGSGSLKRHSATVALLKRPAKARELPRVLTMDQINDACGPGSR